MQICVLAFPSTPKDKWLEQERDCCSLCCRLPASTDGSVTFFSPLPFPGSGTGFVVPKLCESALLTCRPPARPPWLGALGPAWPAYSYLF